MFKKIFIMTLMLIITSFAFSEKAEAEYPNGSSVGAAFTSGYPYGGGISVTGKFAPVPLVFGLNFEFYTNHFGLTLTADWWGFQLPLGQAGEAAVSMYLGPGGVLNFGFGNYDSIGYTYTNIGGDITVPSPFVTNKKSFFMDLGIRMPVGFSFLVKKKWEIYIEPSIGLNIIGVGAYDGKASVRLFGYDNIHDDGWRFSRFLRIGGQVGFRYWF